MSSCQLNYTSCATCHGPGKELLYQGIVNQNQLQDDHNDLGLPWFQIPGYKNLSVSEKLRQFLTAEIDQLPFHPLEKAKRWGFILASTKGLVEESVWNEEPENFEVYQPILDMVEEKFPTSFERKVCVSNACTSSHGAIELGQKWLDRKWVDAVFILAVDLIGPFTLKGFNSLRAISESGKIKAFEKDRDGLLLGDGIACCVISHNPWGEKLEISPIQSLCEGVSATRPSVDGKNLVACYEETKCTNPDVVIAHSTGTHYNDLTESNAMETFLGEQNSKVVGSKWSVGHTLGASGLIDLCLATEMIHRQEVPGVPADPEQVELAIKNYLNFETRKQKVDRVLISSLGFGGMCSALALSRPGEAQ